MKSIRFFTYPFFLSMFFFSCEKETIDYGLDEYKVDLATVLFSDGKAYFLLDNTKTLFAAGVPSELDLQERQRVKINYSLLPDLQQGYDYTVRINSVSKIAQGALTASSASMISQQANDLIQFESAWLGSHYLNLQFNIQYKSQAHKIYLLTDSTRLEDKDIYIYFRHGINNDEPGYTQRITASYDLKVLLGDPTKDRTLLVHFNTSNYGDTIFRYLY